MGEWELVEGHLATPRGFRGAAMAAGIKKVAGALDLSLISSDAEGTSAAGMFTTNLAAAAPVLVSRRNLKASRGRARAIIVNSGNANACTGRAGIRAAVKIRSASPPAAATIYAAEAGRARIVLDRPQEGVAPGQACVFYSGERVLGGGWIERPTAPVIRHAALSQAAALN
jgi:hypothetical protein